MQPEKIHEQVLVGLVVEAARVLDLIDGKDLQHDGEALQQARALLRQITDAETMPRVTRWDGQGGNPCLCGRKPGQPCAFVPAPGECPRWGGARDAGAVVRG